MSFEHRTSIFEAAFRAWSHLGGIEPLDLESKASTDLDPLNFPIENDPRWAAQKNKMKKDAENNNEGGGDDAGGGGSVGGGANKKGDRREYPYEPLPRSGLAHPFVQAILSPWLGPDADQDAIQLGLTTLRTWWQHRRKGESGSAIVALDTDKMRGVVEGYTRHFFNLAHCLVVNDKEQPPRTLHTKMRELEKSRNKKGGKKRGREEDTVIKAAAVAFESGFGPNKQAGGMACGNPNGDGMNPLERLHAAQRRQLVLEGGVHTNVGGGVGLPDPSASNALESMKGRCIPGKVDLHKLVQQVSSSANQLAHRGTSGPVGMGGLPSRLEDVDPSKYGDPNVTPVVAVTRNGQTGTTDYQFCMIIDGITCAHCVKIIETVLKGCNGSHSSIEGLLDAAADLELHVVLVKVGNVADVRRIAHESARILSMVGYTAKAKSVTVPGDMALADVYSIFEKTIPSISPMMGFNWNTDCRCPDNNDLKQDCPRRSQMGPGIIDVFDKTEQLFNVMSTNGGRGAVAAAAAPEQQQQPSQTQGADMTYPQENTAAHGNANAYMSCQQPIQDGVPGGGGGDDTNKGGAGARQRQRLSMSLGGRMSIGGLGGLGRHMSLTSETTFGRAMSGLSALSIDWENMDDFDVNVDHSEGINNDIINSQQQQGQGNSNPGGGASGQQLGGGQDGACDYGGQPLQAASVRKEPRVARRSSLRKNLPVNPNGNMFNVSFNM